MIALQRPPIERRRRRSVIGECSVTHPIWPASDRRSVCDTPARESSAVENVLIYFVDLLLRMSRTFQLEINKVELI